jgi:uncharacterized protein DUF3618
MSIQDTTKTYEREAEATRQRLSSSLDDLATSLTPGTVLDEVLTYARAGGGDFLRGLGNAASTNPIPTLLIGVGAAMFLTGRGRADGHRAGNGHGAGVLRHAAEMMMGRRTYPRHGESDFGEMASGEAYRYGNAGTGRGGFATGPGRGHESTASRAVHGVAGIGRSAASAASSTASGIGTAASRTADSVASAASAAAGAMRSAASSAADAVGTAASSAADAVGSAASSAADTVGSTASRAADAARSGAAAAGATVSGAAGAVRDTAAAGVAAAGDLAASAADLAVDTAGTVADSARAAAASAADLASTAGATAVEQSQYLFDQTARLTRDLTERTNRLIQEQPLAVAAAGLAIGAALAAVLPRTRMEDSVLGETSDTVKETVADATTAQFRRAKEATARVVEEAKNVAEKEGLSATAAVEAVRDIGEKVKHVVTAAGDEATNEGEKTATDLGMSRYNT